MKQFVRRSSRIRWDKKNLDDIGTLGKQSTTGGKNNILAIC